jgi:hypothetical protein
VTIKERGDLFFVTMFLTERYKKKTKCMCKTKIMTYNCLTCQVDIPVIADIA